MTVSNGRACKKKMNYIQRINTFHWVEILVLLKGSKDETVFGQKWQPKMYVVIISIKSISCKDIIWCFLSGVI